MEMTGEQRIAAPRQRVWEALNDPEVLKACIPGCQSLERDGENGFAAVAEVKIGPIGARFKGAVKLNDLDPPNGYTIDGQGNGGVAGNAKGSAKVRLSDDGAGTLVTYNVDAQVGGRMAQLGGPIIDATAKQLAGKFFSRFGEIVGGETAAPATPAEAPAPTPIPAATPAATPFAIPAPAPVQAGASPWGWITALILAIVVGFMIGRTSGEAWWMVMVILLVVVAATAAYETGRRSGGRP